MEKELYYINDKLISKLYLSFLKYFRSIMLQQNICNMEQNIHTAESGVYLLINCPKHE